MNIYAVGFLLLILLLISERFPRVALGFAGLVFLGSLIINAGSYQKMIGGFTA